ncbi:hypothetical protein BDQ17DRAFT_1425341 [Cyathus striatus]|nr:hypothetical protein BDQ17DRAFT_1425341 [Cyathus striatus]
MVRVRSNLCDDITVGHKAEVHNAGQHDYETKRRATWEWDKMQDNMNTRQTAEQHGGWDKTQDNMNTRQNVKQHGGWDKTQDNMNTRQNAEQHGSGTKRRATWGVGQIAGQHE